MSRYRNLSTLTEIIIHCADTPNGRSFGARDIDQWHAARGWHRSQAFISRDYPLQAIGYHFVIDVDGTVENGRKLDEEGAHCFRHNLKSIGLCLIGTDKFTRAQWTALAAKIEAIRNAFPQITRVVGHRFYSAHKTCPGFDVTAFMEGGMRPLAGHVLEDG